MFIASASFSQICTGPLTVAIDGSTTGETLVVTCEGTNPLCNAGSGDLTGSVDVTVDGGSPTYTYVWQMDGNPMTNTTQDLSGLGEGIYSVTVTDDHDCTGTCTVELIEPTPVEVTGIEVDPSCNNADGTLNGTITIAPTGGSTPYTFAWTCYGTRPDRSRCRYLHSYRNRCNWPMYCIRNV